jgi:hypothetical protein
MDGAGERFTSLRKSILENLIVKPSDMSLRDHMELNRVILVDLTDPVLSHSNLDTAIMDIVLRVFLDHESTRRKLIGQYSRSTKSTLLSITGL